MPEMPPMPQQPSDSMAPRFDGEPDRLPSGPSTGLSTGLAAGPIGPRVGRLAALLLLAATSLMPAGCDTVERLPDTAEPARVARASRADVPRIMRGTIGSECTVVGYQPVPVHGWGLVVGLRGTGSRQLPPPDVREYMKREMIRRGVGEEGGPMGEISPERMLAAPDTAIVIVRGLVPPGAVGRESVRGGVLPGTTFDLQVLLDERSDATSLDGGRLFTCELRPMLAGERYPSTGSQQARILAEGKGPVFVNPFAIDETSSATSVDRTRGRILDGGTARIDNPLKLRLRNPSHTRAQIITQALNTRFAPVPGQAEPTARGESDESIELNVPLEHRRNPARFISLLRHSTIRQVNTDSVATSIGRILSQDPGYATPASLRWQALGAPALPVIRSFYDAADEAVREAAIEAGARLRDPLVVPPVLELLESDSVDIRRRAADLLENRIEDPRIDFALLKRTNDEDLEVRLKAYEALNARDSRLLERQTVGGAFALDLVPSDFPMLYVAQVGRPRIVLFGRDTELATPMIADIWSGRLILKTDPIDDEQVEIFFRPRPESTAILHESTHRLRDLIVTFGTRDSLDLAKPGLGMTYAETIGALYELRSRGMLAADFKAEQDRVQQAIIDALQNDLPTGPRPDFESDIAARDAAIDDFDRGLDTEPGEIRRLQNPNPVGDDNADAAPGAALSPPQGSTPSTSAPSLEAPALSGSPAGDGGQTAAPGGGRGSNLLKRGGSGGSGR